jgi:hypothetical protein
MVVGKVAVARQRCEFGEQGVDVILAMGPVGVPRDLTFLPGCQRLVEVAQHLRGLLVKRDGLLLDIHPVVGAGHGPKFLGLAFDLGQGFFEFEVVHAWLHPGEGYMPPAGAICNVLPRYGP